MREQQKEKDDLGLNPEIIGTCPYLLGCRHHHVPKPAHVLRPVMGTKEKLNKGKEDRERNVVGTRESLGNNQHPAKTQQLHKKCDKKYKTKHAQTHPAKCCQVTCDAYHRRRENISHEASINWTAEHNCVLDLKMSSSVSQNNFSTTCLKAYSQQSSSGKTYGIFGTHPSSINPHVLLFFILTLVANTQKLGNYSLGSTQTAARIVTQSTS